MSTCCCTGNCRKYGSCYGGPRQNFFQPLQHMFPPMMLGYDIVTCSACSGLMYIYDENFISKPCSECKGIGKVLAKYWTPIKQIQSWID